MPIAFLPNDPCAAEAQVRTIEPIGARDHLVADFDFGTPLAEAVYPAGTKSFLYWQIRQASLSAIARWESIHGSPLTKWQTGKRVLDLTAMSGLGTNAQYDRSQILFVGNAGYSPASSVDVVSHEIGHALLDTIRPDLFNARVAEVSAFHEAFADCFALLVALSDPLILSALTANDGALLKSSNFVSRFAESLAAAYAANDPNDARAKARDWSGDVSWHPLQDEDPLDEYQHSLAFSGAFYHAVLAAYSQGTTGGDELAAVAQKLGTLLVSATKQASNLPLFFGDVARLMVAGAEDGDRAALTGAFTRHGIALTSPGELTDAEGAILESIGEPLGPGFRPRAQRDLETFRTEILETERARFDRALHEAGRVQNEGLQHGGATHQIIDGQLERVRFFCAEAKTKTQTPQPRKGMQ